MTSKSKSILFAICSAPMGFGLLFVIGLRNGNHDFEVNTPIGLFFVGYFLGLILVIVFALPVFLLMLRHGLVRWWTILLAGCGISALLSIFLGTSVSGVNDILLFVKYGALTSIIFFGAYKFMHAKSK